ncbi:putative ubiquinone/menaquinone biosynthesis methyltransferae [Neospora caninum Liverpool]|uniref:2-methoxy-6-polyprenyl-1,4-benzoquinol methylase, mitochondrial n=1 Tax=Neospora caninum (strain Liverpool) TaxID=572307 RepID=F0V7N5_NEOCL|nr:putative ubiquinone/menaquinone biosynthesis methyltransferae [Neospora caninum Liverpool]CBZ49726.1 putative ubiquinone/menaquinone biosynthesis methyltransferae [Neospora caninum Liverpool]CEL64310.1 TPA: ubiquinone/menaquinone biosynthesis methyltransferae, putative [Neospora caninum Liverpool]|eukprot:XP_003879761.1 putative ubiquinone/menaquinone biosynthesis methyltransferae [Neospora caninum Liverpool]
MRRGTVACSHEYASGLSPISFLGQRQAFSALKTSRCTLASTVSSSASPFAGHPRAALSRPSTVDASTSLLSRHVFARFQHSLHSAPHRASPGADSSEASDATASFGYRQVPKAQKQQMVASVFSSVAERYDLMNDLMSMGLHRCWKDAFVDLVQFPTLQPNSRHPACSGDQQSRRFRILDLAGGTGDIAFRFVEKAEAQWSQQQAIRRKRQAASSACLAGERDSEGDVEGEKRAEAQTTPASFSGIDVTVCDINADMLRVGQQRAVERGLPVSPIVHSHQEVEMQLAKQRLQEASERTKGGFDGRWSAAEASESRFVGAESDGVPLLLQWVCGNGEQLPFADESYDVVTIAFGIRNFTDVKKGLKEAARVLRPGGRFLCLEFSRVENPTLAALYDIFSFNALPLMGSVVAGDREAYQYLVESIRKFPPQEEFAAMMADAGFHHVAFSNLTFGTVAIHSGFKLGKH